MKQELSETLERADRVLLWCIRIRGLDNLRRFAPKCLPRPAEILLSFGSFLFHLGKSAVPQHIGVDRKKFHNGPGICAHSAHLLVVRRADLWLGSVAWGRNRGVQFSGCFFSVGWKGSGGGSFGFLVAGLAGESRQEDRVFWCHRNSASALFSCYIAV